MRKLIFSLILGVALVSCTSHRLPAFSGQAWHVDSYTGNAVSTDGLEFAFGSEWMVTDTTLIQSAEQLAKYPKLESFLSKGIAQFPEIVVDSIYFYNPHRGLLFAEYHQAKPLEPNSEILLYDGSVQVYNEDYSRIFGVYYTMFDPSGWENGPKNSAYSNVYYKQKKNYLVHLLRIPYSGHNIAIFQIHDYGKRANLDGIATYLHSSRNTAVENLRISTNK